MSHEAPTPPSNEQPFTIEGEASTVTVVNPEYIEKMLGVRGRHIELLRKTDEDLPVPCREATITYEYDENVDEFYLNADISFTPQEYDSKYNWSSLLLDYIKESLELKGATVIVLPYHQSTLYAKLDDTYAARIGTSEETREHGINMRVEYLKDVYRELNIDYDSTSEDDQVPSLALLRSYVTHWNLVLSSVTRLYGKPGEKADITMHLAEVVDTTSPSKELVKASSEENKVNTNMPPRRTLKDIGGATDAKEQLLFNTLVFKNPELAQKYDVHPTGFILHGPAGTGKSSLAEAFANEINAEFRVIPSTDIVSKWVGTSGGNAAEIFQSARETKDNLVLFFDEFDSLAPKGTTGTTEREDVKNVFKRELTALAEHPNIVVVAATNKDPGEFDEALIRAGRLQPIYVPIPNEHERIDIWGVLLWQSIDKLHLDRSDSNVLTIETLEHVTSQEQLHPYADDIDLTKYARETEDMTGADINEILHIVRKRKFIQAISQQAPLTISDSDILSAIRSYRKP